MGLFGFGKKKKNEEVEQAPPVDCSLIILCEAVKNGIVQYFADNGIKIRNVLTSIEDTKIEVMTVQGPCRLVIVESGTGKFITQEARRDICDLLGLSDDNTHATVFYTNSAIKTTIRNESKNMKLVDVDYVEYGSMLTVLDKLLEYNETYVYGGADDEKESIGLEYKGQQLEDILEDNVFREEFKDEQVVGNIEGEESIQQFETKF